MDEVKSLCGKVFEGEKAEFKRDAHQRKCKKCDEIFKTKPVLEPTLRVPHILNVLGKRIEK